MNGLNPLGPLSPLAERLRSVRTRTWLILGAAGLVLLGLVGWAAIATLSWMWAQAPVVADAAKRLGGEVTAQIEQTAPVMADAGKRLGGEATAQIQQTAPGLTETLDRWVPGLRATLERWIPGLARAPAQDVSGTDIGPVPRYPGMVRTYFARDAKGVEVAFLGSATLNAVVAHYVKGFTAARFAHEVLAATADGEQHRFRQAQQTFELALTRRAGGLIEVRLKQLAIEQAPVRR